MFGDKSEAILELLEYGSTDGAVSLIAKNVLQTCIDVLPILEHQVRNSDGARGTFGFNQLVSSIREQIGDLQALQDRGLLGQRIVERQVRPAYQAIATQMVMAFTSILEEARRSMPKDEYDTFRSHVSQTQASLGDYMMMQYREIEEGIKTSLT